MLHQCCTNSRSTDGNRRCVVYVTCMQLKPEQLSSPISLFCTTSPQQQHLLAPSVLHRCYAHTHWSHRGHNATSSTRCTNGTAVAIDPPQRLQELDMDSQCYMPPPAAMAAATCHWPRRSTPTQLFWGHNLHSREYLLPQIGKCSVAACIHQHNNHKRTVPDWVDTGK